jgi:uncharacterized surface anchored protein
MASVESTSRSSSRVLRELLAVPVVLVVLMAPAVADATEPTSGYTTTTETTTSVPPKQETPQRPSTSPSKEIEKAKAVEKPKEIEKANEVESSSPSREVEKPHQEVQSFNEGGGTSAPKAKKLPFTGFDLRWTLGFGLLLTCAGFSIVAAQRHRRERSR